MSGDVPRPPSRLAPLSVNAALPGSGMEFVERADGAFVHWHVHEVDAHAVPGTRGPRCLLFLCDGVIRRVWEYPANWRSLDDAALGRLSWRR